MNDRPSTDFTVWFGGSASGSPGRGGYAAVVIDGRSGLVSAEVSSSADETTLVDMLVAGAIAGLSLIPREATVTVNTFSDTMMQNAPLLSSGEEVSTLTGEWQTLAQECSLRSATWVQVDQGDHPVVFERLYTLATDAAFSANEALAPPFPR